MVALATQSTDLAIVGDDLAVEYWDPDGDTVRAGQLLQQARERARISQKTLGEMLIPPASQVTVSKWEAGKYRIRANERRTQIAQILGLAMPPADYQRNIIDPIDPVEPSQLRALDSSEVKVIHSQVLSIRANLNALLAQIERKP